MNSLYIIIFCIIVLFVYNLFQRYQNKCKKFDDSIFILYRQVARWAAASLQDDSELIRLLHANYATGYLWAIKDIVSTDDFQRITGEDYLAFENKIVAVQDTASKMMVDKCKSLVFLNDPVILKAMYSRQPI